jgi:AhpD family alkylhydroperoxidase
MRLESGIQVDATARDFVKLRASQINGCAFCIDMDWKDARAAGESEERLYSRDAWRESPRYCECERAAVSRPAAASFSTSHTGRPRPRKPPQGGLRREGQKGESPRRHRGRRSIGRRRGARSRPGRGREPREDRDRRIAA